MSLQPDKPGVGKGPPPNDQRSTSGIPAPLPSLTSSAHAPDMGSTTNIQPRRIHILNTIHAIERNYLAYSTDAALASALGSLFAEMRA